MDKERIKELIERIEKAENGFTDDEFHLAIYIICRIGKAKFNNYLDSIELDEIYATIKQQESIFDEELNDEVSEILSIGD